MCYEIHIFIMNFMLYSTYRNFLYMSHDYQEMNNSPRNNICCRTFVGKSVLNSTFIGVHLFIPSNIVIEHILIDI